MRRTKIRRKEEEEEEDESESSSLNSAETALRAPNVLQLLEQDLR
jgi:hypothetical protein